MTTPGTDEQLLADFLGGRRAALGELARRYERPLLGLALGLLGGRRDLACDAVQETWLRVIRFGRQFSSQSRFKTWLYRIGINQCRNLQSATGRPAAGDGEPTLAGKPAPDPAPETVAARTDQHNAVRRAVARLAPDRRAIVLLCYHGGLTHVEAAEILELPLGTLKSRLHAALEELRGMLGATCRTSETEAGP